MNRARVKEEGDDGGDMRLKKGHTRSITPYPKTNLFHLRPNVESFILKAEIEVE
jgi:hypothetical protein